MNQYKKTNILIAILITISMISWSGVFMIRHINAQSQLVFGGFVTFSYYCSCSGNFLIYVSPPRGGQFIYQPGATRMFAYYTLPRSGIWVLGDYFPYGVCLQYAGYTCTTVGAPQGTMNMVGTSY
jgi:hypothetical protein